ncbi:MAG: hypothetical protein J7623_16455 [Chitinophaga sp.]|uniref:hypothetical protein n=1 Tax=Chitinophaga sp. TaxID=1869181 RepID=UPI001B0E7537|nr:hypothetical protein [Chitinophaga sp.]MBO9730233.1 hypothetical protein [Chitinophaga sp.]
MSIPKIEFPEAVIKTFHQVYDNDLANLKKLPPILREMGICNTLEIIILARQELGLGLGEAIMALEVPDISC